MQPEPQFIELKVQNESVSYTPQTISRYFLPHFLGEPTNSVSVEADVEDDEGAEAPSKS